MTPRLPTPAHLVNVRGTQLLASDTRDTYRQKIARIAMDEMYQFVAVLDTRGTLLEVNRAALEGGGLTLPDVEGKPFWKCFWWGVSKETQETLEAAIARTARGEFIRYDVEVFGRAGGKETIIIDFSMIPVKDETGTVVFIVPEGRDITEKKAQEREIARQREELAKLDVLKTQFFANISHEFRTPLTLMMGPLEDAIAQPQELSALNRERLVLAHRNSLRLLKLVNSLLEFSRIEAGRIQARFEPVELGAFTAELASVFRAATERAGLGLVVQCPPLPEPVHIDRDMWEKIVLNLVSNAFKFTFTGEIEVKLEAVAGEARLTVRDTGVGIPADSKPRIFERFYRVENSRSRTQEGTGIGLALVQELVKLHGGTIRAESRVGAGTTFTVTMPFGTAHLPAEKTSGPRGGERLFAGATSAAFAHEALGWLPDGAGSSSPETLNAPVRSSSEKSTTNGTHPSPAPTRARVLLADDNADMRGYIARLLGEHYEIEAVPDGAAALEAARRHAPDLILSDVMMPNLDGFGLIREIRADAALKALPVILLSARAGEESRVDGLEHGADDYLTKPFSARELLARVNAQLNMAKLRQETTETLRQSHQELSERAETLHTFNRVAVGRELRMLELKRELNELCQQLGQPPRYPLEPEPEALTRG